jgi:prevent-host-death family protein
MAQIISKSAFKPHALKYFRQVQEKGEEIIITDHSRPVIKIIPYREEATTVLQELRNSVKRYDSPFDPVGGEDWESLK